MTYVLLLIYIPVAVYIVIRVLRKRQTAKSKWLAGVVTVFLLYLPLGWDVILGRAYFYYLCSTQGGVHVYQTVTLGSEYFDEGGIPRFYDNEKFFEQMQLADIYVGRRNFNRDYIKILNIAERTHTIVDKNTENILGSFVEYTYFGGWFINHTGFHVGGESCFSNEKFSEKLRDLPKSIFISK